MLVLAPRGDGSSRHRTMARTRRSLVALALIAITTSVGTAQPSAGTTGELRLDNLSGLQLQGVRADIVTYRGRRAVHLLEQPGAGTADWKAPGEAMAIIIGSDFTDGVIEAELSGAPKAGAAEGSRGFVGVAFRVPPGGSSFECFYLRPTNGRADDQLRRNHSTQYISFPDYPWERLRKETPGVYESYVDLEPGVWTTIRIVVEGSKARLYVNGATQPTLIVNDLKLGATRGAIALWTGPDTEAYFSRLTVKPGA